MLFVKLRNGVEILCSILRGKYHADNLPRGKMQVGQFFRFKVDVME